MTQEGPPGPKRFLTLSEVAEELSCSAAQAYSLVRTGALPAIKIGGLGRWRIARSDLDAFVAKAYADTRAFIVAHPRGAARAEGPVVTPDGQDPAPGAG